MDMINQRQGLKCLADFAVDAQFYHQYGTQFLTRQDEQTPEHSQLCDTLSEVIEDIMAGLEIIKAQISAVTSE